MSAFVLAALMTMKDAQALALLHAPAVIAAQARVDETVALARAARGQGLPHAIVNYNQTPQAGPVSGTVLQKLTTYGGQVTIGDLLGRDPAVAQADAVVRGARENEIDAERTERIKVVGLYVDAERTREVEHLRFLMVSSLVEDRRAAQLRYDAGDAPHLDVLRADVELAQARAEFAQAEADERNARSALALETGREDAKIEVEPLNAAGISMPAGVTIETGILFALAHRPEIAAANEDLASERAALRAANLGRLPAITAQAGYTTGVDTALDVHGASANVTLDLPIGGATAAQAAAQQARIDQARARVDAATQAVTLDVTTSITSLQAALGAAQATAAARNEAEQEVSGTELGYRSGASSSLELIDARRAFAEAELNDVVSRATLIEDRAVLNLALGVQP